MSKSARLVLLNRIIFVLSILGVATAAYVLQGWLRKAAIICPTGGCEAVSKNAVSYPLGIPVPAIGLAGYSFLAILAFLRSLSLNSELKTKLLVYMLGMAAFGVCFVTWFTAMELFVIKSICLWCAISAVNMGIIFGLTTKSIVLTRISKQR